MNDADIFLAQFPAARAEVAELARLYPQCFDANGRPIVATLTWPTTRTDQMNLQTAADRYYSAAASEPATDVHPLGAPINRAKPTQDDPGRWVPAATPGYHIHTKTGVLSRDSDVPFDERPWHKPATVKADPGICLDSGEFIPAAKLADDSATCAVPSVDALIEAYERVPHKRLDDADMMLCAATGWRSFNWADIPADRRADVIRALNQLGR